jgi:hypothetical protein
MATAASRLLIRHEVAGGFLVTLPLDLPDAFRRAPCAVSPIGRKRYIVGAGMTCPQAEQVRAASLSKNRR